MTWILKNTQLDYLSCALTSDLEMLSFQSVCVDLFCKLWCYQVVVAAAAAAESLQSCPTLCDPTDSSPPGPPIPGIFQAKVLEWVAIAFSSTRLLVIIIIHSEKQYFKMLSGSSQFSVQFSSSVMPGSLWPYGLQHSRLRCPSPTLGACSNSCPLNQWCHPTISSFIISFSSFLWSFPAWGSFPISQFFSRGQVNFRALQEWDG